jgi:5S rRNA maturation endonuclease (ribonuclease M5)
MRSPISDSDLQTIAEQAGISLSSHWFPQVSKCPHCEKSTLSIYKDTLYGGLWTHCNYCQFSGDLLEILSIKWKMDYLHVLRQLSKITYIPINLINSEDAGRFAALASRKEKIREFLTNSDAVATFTPSQDIMHSLGVTSFEEFPTGFKKQFRALRYGERHPEDETVIVQKGHNCAITVPLYDLPGRVVGWVSFTDHEKPQTKYTYLPEFREVSGICFPEQFNDNFAEFDNHTLVTASVKTALSMQFAAIKRRKRLLPVIGMGELKSRTNMELWAELPTRNLVFLAKKYPEFAIREARYAGAKVVFRDMKVQDKWNLEVDQFGKMLEKAMPWEEAVEKLILDTEAAQLNSMLQTLNFDEEFWDTYLPSFTPKARMKVDNNVRKLGKVVTVKSKPVNWKESKWVDHKGNTICNAPFQIDRIYEERSAIKASGKIFYEGQEFNFVEELDTIEKNPEKWLKQHMVRQRIGLPLVSPDWKKQLLVIAQKFKSPVVDGGAPRVGWDDKFKEFRFPNVTVSMDGLEGSSMFFPEHCPGKHMWPHVGFSDFEIAQLGTKSSTKYAYLNLLTTVTSALTARACMGRVESFIVNQGKDDTTALNFAKALDLHVITINGRTTVEQIEEIEAAAKASDLPVFVDCRNGDNARVRSTFQQLIDTPIPGVVALASREAARIASTTGWVMIDIPSFHKTTDSFADALPKILTSYLEDVCQRRFNFRAEATRSETLVSDLADWFASLTGIETVKMSMLNYIKQPMGAHGHAQVFWKVLSHLTETRSLREGSELVYTPENSVLIDFPKLQEVCQTKTGLKFDVDVIKNSLEGSNYLLGCDNEVWELPKMILDSYCEEYRKFGVAG